MKGMQGKERDSQAFKISIKSEGKEEGEGERDNH